jgi:uncharacterized membrane protein
MSKCISMNTNERVGHNDSANWKWGMFYYNPKDERLFPPKRHPGAGWTVNFAQKRSILASIMVGIFLNLLIHWIKAHVM